MHMEAYFLWTCMGLSSSYSLWSTVLFQMTIQKRVHFFLMFKRDACNPLMQLLNPKLRYVGNDKSIFAPDAVWDIYGLVIPNVKLARET